MGSETILNDVKFGCKDYRVYCGSDAEGWELLDMQERRVTKLAISLKGFFNDTYNNPLNSVLYASKVNGKGVYYPVFITLTYEDQDLWESKDISRLIDYYRKDWQQRLGRDPSHFRYVWVAEMQKRGVIHYHLVLWCPRGKSLAKPDTDAGWHKGMSNIIGVRKGVIGYLSKYLSKGSKPAEHEGSVVYFPKGARIFGMGGLSSAARGKIAYKKLPRYVREYFDHSDGKVKKVLGGYEQGSVCLMSPYAFEVIKYSPVEDKYSPVGWSGGNLTCILITYDRKWVMLADKEEYLKEMECGNEC